MTEPQPITFKPKDYKSDKHSDWCSSCGDFGILTAMQQAFAKLQIPPHELMVLSGVGCSAKTPHYINAYGVHTLHGRVLSFATGARLSNPALTVVAVGGDGDGYGIGGGQFLAAGRRNVDLAYIVAQNSVYGLTKGQPSPTFKKGSKTRHMAEPSMLEQLNPLAVAINAGYTFVARSFAYDVKLTADIIARAIEHRGTALVDILQACPAFAEGLYSKDWAAGTDQENTARTYRLEERGYDGRVSDPSDPAEIRRKKLEAIGLTMDDEPVPLGVYYQIDLPTYEDQLAERQPDYARTPLARDPKVYARALAKYADELK